MLELTLKPGTRLFAFSDGVTDQFGRPEGIVNARQQKLGQKRLHNFLVETSSLGLTEQGKAFTHFFEQWMQTERQLDDVLWAAFEVE